MTLRFHPSLLALAGLTVGCGSRDGQLDAAHRAAIVDSVQVMLTGWRDALNAREMARATTFYSPDGDFRWFEDGELKYRSAVELADTMKAAGQGVRTFTLSLIEPQITALAPGVAVVTTNFAQKMTDTTGNTFGLAGAISATVVHGRVGWQFLVGHTSSVVMPADTVKALHKLDKGAS